MKGNSSEGNGEETRERESEESSSSGESEDESEDEYEEYILEPKDNNRILTENKTKQKTTGIVRRLEQMEKKLHEFEGRLLGHRIESEKPEIDKKTDLQNRINTLEKDNFTG